MAGEAHLAIPRKPLKEELQFVDLEKGIILEIILSYWGFLYLYWEVRENNNSAASSWTRSVRWSDQDFDAPNFTLDGDAGGRGRRSSDGRKR